MSSQTPLPHDHDCDNVDRMPSDPSVENTAPVDRMPPDPNEPYTSLLGWRTLENGPGAGSGLPSKKARIQSPKKTVPSSRMQTVSILIIFLGKYLNLFTERLQLDQEKLWQTWR